MKKALICAPGPLTAWICVEENYVSRNLLSFAPFSLQKKAEGDVGIDYKPTQKMS
jgi:hypothetical protein